MTQVLQVGKWSAKPIIVGLRQHEQFGCDYTGTCVLTICGDIAHFEMLKSDDFSVEDYNNFKELARQYGCKEAVFERIKDGKVLIKKVKL